MARFCLEEDIQGIFCEELGNIVLREEENSSKLLPEAGKFGEDFPITEATQRKRFPPRNLKGHNER